MSADRKITCTNKDGVSITFTEEGFEPFLLMSIEGVYDSENEVTMSNHTMIDGATYQGSIKRPRNIVLTFRDEPNFAENRASLDELFKDGEEGTFLYEDSEGDKRIITYYVENTTSEGTHSSRIHTVSLLCPDPFFYAVNDAVLRMAEWNGLFEFPHEFFQWEEIGYRSHVKMRSILNKNAMDNIGMIIQIYANDTVVNPWIIIVEQNKRIKVGGNGRDLTMVAGDILEIRTVTGDKHVYFTHEGVKEEINYMVTGDSEYIQLKRGWNNVGYDADSGSENMTIRLTYRLKFRRA
jgi:hypothetical protein